MALIVARILVASFRRFLKHTKIPELAANFLVQFTTSLLYVAVLLLFFSALGIAVSSVILGLSAVLGLILGFGMQDTLANLAAGVWLATLEPFSKGDNVTVSNQTGHVKDIGLMSIELITPDNTYIMIPNRIVWGSAIINMTRLPIRRFDLTMTFKLLGDVDGTIRAVMDVLKKNPEVLQDPEPKIYISSLGDTTADLQIYAWVDKEKIALVPPTVKEELLREFGDSECSKNNPNENNENNEKTADENSEEQPDLTTYTDTDLFGFNALR